MSELVSPSKEEYHRRIAEGLAAGEKGTARILAFKSKVSGARDLTRALPATAGPPRQASNAACNRAPAGPRAPRGA